jgi:hypothetical protein
MNCSNAAVLIVLATLQAPRPAATPTTVASKDETLRGVSAMSVLVHVEGKLIDATATKADIETKLRQRGIRVLDRGLPRLHLQVCDARILVPGTAGGNPRDAGGRAAGHTPVPLFWG